MADAYFSAATLDDVMRDVVDAIRSRGAHINPSKGPAAELTGVLIEITNPRARLSRTETRGRLFSGLGELCWYLAKTDRADFISYYLSRYLKLAEGDALFGAYGPRLFDCRGNDQISNVISLLRSKRDSRQAVVQIFDAADIAERHKDVPCTCTFQFMIRNRALQMLTSMRSNDVFIGLPHDVFSFTMIQEVIARVLSVDIGAYKHFAGSLHLYDSDLAPVQRFLDEGWQATDMPMPPMPVGDPWTSIRLLLEMEAQIRLAGELSDADAFAALDPYWADLVRLLQIFNYSKTGAIAKIQTVRQNMASNVYDAFIEAKLNQRTP